MLYQGRHEHIGDGMIRFIHRWQPEGNMPWAALVIMHGLGDHGGRYDRMARWFARHGLVIHAVDLVGHGRSFGKRGCIASYDSLMHEVNASVRLAENEWPDLPCFLFGQSMGGNLVLNWALRSRPRLAGVIASAPMLQVAKAPSPQFLRVGRNLARWIPHWCLRAAVNANLLTRDLDEQQAYLDDRLVHRQVSLRLGFSLVDSGQWALDHADSLRIPTYLLHGLDDQLTSPRASELFASRNPEFVELQLWPGLRHDLHSEPEWTRVLDTLRRWMANRISLRDRRLAA